MLQRGGRLLLSPSDLNNFLACEHRTALDLARARGEILLQRVPRPGRRAGRRARPRARARAPRSGCASAGCDVVRDRARARAPPEATAEAMRAGRDVIHQAAFAAGTWRGAADFLLKVRVPSDLGPSSYEPADAKLATHPKPYVIFQLLFYAAMVGQIQGLAPERVHVVLGTDETPLVPPARLPGLRRPRPGAASSARCRRTARARSRRTRIRSSTAPTATGGRAAATAAAPTTTCRSSPCITRAQAIKLEDAGVRRVTELADVAGGRVRAGDLRARAGRRCASRRGCRSRAATPTCRCTSGCPARPGRGFARLPPPSPGDVFFDIEGDPYWGRGGPGVPVRLAHARTATSRCGRTTARRSGRRSSAGWTGSRRGCERHPDLHVYHYNHYEPTALKALMARYGTREAEVDDLLRRKVFVDLYTIVRQALRIGTESYSLKAVEAMYPFERDAEVTEAGGSILAYQEYLATPRRGQARRDRRLQRRRLPLDAGPARLAAGRARRRRLPWTPRRRAPPSAQQLARHAEVERLGGRRCWRAARTRASACSPTCSSTTGARRGPSGGRTSTGSAAPPASCATTTRRRSATSCRPTTSRSARSRSPTCTRCASRPSSTSSRPGSPSTR